DRRAPETDAPGRTAAYHSLYNQVRSDQSAIKDAYEEARKHLEQRDFKAALAICDEYLARYPGHALFEALKVDVEEHQRQELSAFIARMDREVEAEPDLEKRVGILRQALEKCPGEAHFERALQLTASRRDLVNSIAAKARVHEQQGQYSEALAQWDILRTIYPRYPGLDVEIERMGKRREQQARPDEPGQQSEQERIEAIVSFLRRKLEEAPAPEAPRPIPAKPRKAKPLIYFSAAVVVALSVVLVAVLIFRDRGKAVPAPAAAVPVAAPPPVTAAAPSSFRLRPPPPQP
ncbi:MAG: hypothetical protein M1541_07010, partial [Acidobacteria bacterium]|nr:hypothetical protein [Acidobacteriota bacterium]